MSEENNIDLLDLSKLNEWLPLPYLIIEKNGEIVFINNFAIDFLKKTNKTDFRSISNIKEIIVDVYQFNDIIRDLNRNEKVVNRKILVRFKFNEITIIELTACYIKPLREKVFIHFSDISTLDKKFYTNLASHYKQEIQKLKPYLNKAGQEVQNQILTKDFLEEALIKTPSINNRIELIHEQRLAELSKLFPELTTNELIICSLLSLKLSYEEISEITKKTSNSLRVAFHRILTKLKFDTAHDFFTAVSATINL